MAETPLHILLDRYLTGDLTAAEKQELSKQMEMPGNEVIIERFVENIMVNGNYGDEYNSGVKERLFAFLEENIKNEKFSAPVHRVHFLKTAWFRYAAAILIILVSATYIWMTTNKEKQPLVTTTPITQADILPGNNKASLTLSDGRKIELDSATSEIIADGSAAIRNTAGQLLYKSEGHTIGVNTMSTPSGGQYQLTLSDGTKAWLNAASSITYPISFTGKTREVSITGEVYFEIKADKQKPFIVKGKETITVLGTSFNVNAYENEPSSKTSLVEGAIKINDTSIKPGQAYQDGKIINTDIQQDIAWKNGYFNFEGADLQAIMRQLERWYGIEVKYSRPVAKRTFKGKLPRSLNLSAILEILQQVNIKYHIVNRTLYIE